MENLSMLLIVGVLIAVILLAFFIFYSPSTKVLGKSTTTAGSTTINTTTISNVANVSTIATTTVKPNPPTYCKSSSSVVYLNNYNFGTDSYYQWNTTGTGFGAVPLSVTKANTNGTYYQYPWTYYYSYYIPTTYSQLHPITPGTLTSSNFIVVQPYLVFQIISANTTQLYVQILQNGNPIITRYYNTLNVSGATMTTFSWATIDLSSYMCQTLQVRVVANVRQVSSSDQTKFIAVDYFELSASPYQTYGIANGGT